MKNLRQMIFILAAFCTVSPLAYGKKGKKSSSESSDSGSGGKDYKMRFGMAGCGFWSTVITDKSRGAQLGVWALRYLPYVGSIDSQTSAISSGTSNCVDARQYEEAEQLTFVTVNLASLTKEAAQGAGQHLESFAQILGCPYNEFAQLSQDRYGEIFKDQNPDEVLSHYLREVRADSSLASTCQRVG